jgi:hypothetical protein
VKASTWKWIAIAFIALFAFMTLLAWIYYYDYNATMSSLNACELGAASSATASSATSSVSTPSEQFLVNDQTVNEPAGSAYDFNFNIQYPGFIVVMVLSSTTSNTYVEISGTSINGWTYDSGQISVGTGGNVYFPVVPGQVTVAIGNTNMLNGATETVTIIYYSYS